VVSLMLLTDELSACSTWGMVHAATAQLGRPCLGTWPMANGQRVTPAPNAAALCSVLGAAGPLPLSLHVASWFY
jgi:hypothetical protein